MGGSLLGSTLPALGLLEKGGRNADLSGVTNSAAYQRQREKGGAEDCNNEAD